MPASAPTSTSATIARPPGRHRRGWPGWAAVILIAVLALSGTAASAQAVDTQAPTLQFIDVELTLVPPSKAIVTYDTVVSDNVSAPEDISVLCIQDSGFEAYLPPLGPLLICVATDEAQNEALWTYSLDFDPTVDVPGDQVVGLEIGSATTVVDFTATGADYFGRLLTPECDPASGSAFDAGTTTVTCTVTDYWKQTAEATFDVTVVDHEAPVLSVPDGITVGTDPGAATAVVDWEVTATDNVGVAALACDPTTGATFALGTTTVSCTAQDAAGNQVSATFDVTVEDRAAPTLVLPDDIVRVATTIDGTAVTFDVTATDNVGVTSSTCDVASGSVFGLGTTTVTCSAQDAAGNGAQDSFTVEVEVAAGPAGIDILIAEIEGAGHPRGVERSLVGRLGTAGELLADDNPNNDDAVCDKLDDFLDAVEDRAADGALADGVAERYDAYARALLVGLGCAG